jgi:hypothetical protein
MKLPKVMTEQETLGCALSGRSIARFGDGELRLALGGSAVSQQADPKLQQELQSILRDPGPELVCIPNYHTTVKKNWDGYALDKYVQLYKPDYLYGSAFISRPDSAPWIDTPEYWNSVEALWKGKKVILVVGDRRSLRSEEIQPEAKYFYTVTGPGKNAYANIDWIERAVVDAWRVSGDPMQYAEDRARVLMCLGATATVLAHRLAKRGIQAIDLGHVGMFKRHSGQYNPANKEEVARVRVSSYEMDDLASQAYVQQLRQHHAEVGWGKAGASHAMTVATFADELQAQTILDYGCGRATLGVALEASGWVHSSDRANVVQEFDPGIEEKSAMPKPADLVVATDVLEHVEVENIDNVLKHIRDLSLKGVFLVIALGIDKKHTLPDGRNAHILIRDYQWWLAKLKEMRLKVVRHELRKGLYVWITR